MLINVDFIRHCEERSDAAIHHPSYRKGQVMDCFAVLAMTENIGFFLKIRSAAFFVALSVIIFLSKMAKLLKMLDWCGASGLNVSVILFRCSIESLWISCGKPANLA